MRVRFQHDILPSDFPERLAQANGYPLRFAQGFALGMKRALEGREPHGRVFYNGCSLFAAGYRGGFNQYCKKVR